MARPRKAVSMRRIELRLPADEAILRELAQEAQMRGVELTQHIHDRRLLRGPATISELVAAAAAEQGEDAYPAGRCARGRAGHQVGSRAALALARARRHSRGGCTGGRFAAMH